jgi:hypothetical protein
MGHFVNRVYMRRTIQSLQSAQPYHIPAWHSPDTSPSGQARTQSRGNNYTAGSSDVKDLLSSMPLYAQQGTQEDDEDISATDDSRVDAEPFGESD